MDIDDPIDELMGRLDPAAADHPPTPGSPRHTSILESAMSDTPTTVDTPMTTEPASVDAPSISPGKRTSPSAPPHRWAITLASAAAVVAVLAGGLFLATRGGSSDTTAPAGPAADPTEAPPSSVPAAHGTNPVADALAATLAEQAMAVVIEQVDAQGPRTELWHYAAPDRWEALELAESTIASDHPPAGTSARLFVGGRTWAADDGRWVEETRPSARTPFPVAMFDGLGRADCAATVTGVLVAWSSSEAPCPQPGSHDVGELPVGTTVATIEVDDQGRLELVRTGTVLDFGDDVELSGSSQLINRLSAAASTTARFWYDDVPEVSAVPTD